MELATRPKWPERHVRGPDKTPVPFHRAQQLGWESEQRIILLSAGTQSGKTSWLPWWLRREIARCGSGDYIGATSTYKLFSRKFLPEFLAVFCDILDIGRYWAGDQIIELKDPETGRFRASNPRDDMWGRILMGSAQSPGSLESATAKAAILDECGQDSFLLRSYEAITRRLHVHHGRMAMGTTLYNWGWVKGLIDRAKAGGATHAEYIGAGEIEQTTNEALGIDVIQYDSIINPVFDVDEYERARATMASDDFDLFYRGRVGKPRTMIYDCWDPKVHLVPAFPIPRHWPRVVGVDPLGEYVVAHWLAWDPERQQLHIYREYYAPFGETTSGHAHAILEASHNEPIAAFCGGGPSERQQRADFAGAGLPLQAPPITNVWAGINRVYELLKTFKLVVHQGKCPHLVDEIGRYQRKKDKEGNATDTILNKDTYHALDDVRYSVAWLTGGEQTTIAYQPSVISRRY